MNLREHWRALLFFAAFLVLSVLAWSGILPHECGINSGMSRSLLILDVAEAAPGSRF